MSTSVPFSRLDSRRRGFVTSGACRTHAFRPGAFRVLNEPCASDSVSAAGAPDLLESACTCPAAACGHAAAPYSSSSAAAACGRAAAACSSPAAAGGGSCCYLSVPAAAGTVAAAATAACTDCRRNFVGPRGAGCCRVYRLQMEAGRKTDTDRSCHLCPVRHGLRLLESRNQPPSPSSSPPPPPPPSLPLPLPPLPLPRKQGFRAGHAGSSPAI
jgi:hypothetical protein